MVKSSGSNLVQRPPGLRKSGMPDSVLTPAPVKTTMRFASAIIFATRPIFSFVSCVIIVKTIAELRRKDKTKNLSDGQEKEKPISS